MNNWVAQQLAPTTKEQSNVSSVSSFPCEFFIATDGKKQELIHFPCIAQPARKAIGVLRKEQKITSHEESRHHCFTWKNHSTVFWIAPLFIDLRCFKEKVIFWLQGFSNQLQFHSLGYGAGHTQNGFVLFCFVDCVLLLELMRSTDILLAQYCLRKCLKKNFFLMKWQLKRFQIFV